MSYLAFHFVFILPPILLLAVALRLRPPPIPRSPWWFIPLIALIAFVYTTPWDNYLIWRGVWGYGTERVIGTIGYVPIEEYMFFGLQPLLTGMWTFLLLGWMRGAADGPSGAGGARVRLAGTLLYLVLAGLGAAFLLRDSTTYLGLILAWACPVLAGQWSFAGAEVWARRRLAALAIGVPTIYLWIADGIAIGLGIWEISDRYTIGLGVGTLPMEEATFFLVTNVLVVQGLILFLFPPGGASRTLSRERAGSGVSG